MYYFKWLFFFMDQYWETGSGLGICVRSKRWTGLKRAAIRSVGGGSGQRKVRENLKDRRKTKESSLRRNLRRPQGKDAMAAVATIDSKHPSPHLFTASYYTLRRTELQNYTGRYKAVGPSTFPKRYILQTARNARRYRAPFLCLPFASLSTVYFPIRCTAWPYLTPPSIPKPRRLKNRQEKKRAGCVLARTS